MGLSWLLYYLVDFLIYVQNMSYFLYFLYILSSFSKQIITAKSGDGTNYQFRDDWM